MSEENQVQEETQAAEGVTLGVADLSNAAQVIDIAVQRGAFRAGEVSQVGDVFNKLSAFVNQVQAQQKAQEESEKETAEVAE
jgi:translation initiation factor IF-2